MVRTESHLVLAEHSGRRHQQLQDSVALVIRKCQAQQAAAAGAGAGAAGLWLRSRCASPVSGGVDHENPWELDDDQGAVGKLSGAPR